MRAHTRLPELLAACLVFSIPACVGTMDGTANPSGGSGPGGSSGDDVGGGGDTSGSEETFESLDCPAGQGALFQNSDDIDPPSDGTIDGEKFTSGVRAGSGGLPMIVSCASTGCGAGQVGVEVDVNPLQRLEEPTAPASSSVICVEAPPACGTGTSPFWVGSVPDPENGSLQTGGFWTCSERCEVVVDFGGLYGFQSACTTAPPSCSGGTPTFTFESQEWECAPMCDGGLYDPVDFEGTTVCVPC
jgi:hypothetical protein